MEDAAAVQTEERVALQPVGRQASWTIAIGSFLGVLSLLAPVRIMSIGLLTAAATLLVVGVLLIFKNRRRHARQASTLDVIADFIWQDATPSVVTFQDGAIKTVNPAAAKTYNVTNQQTLAGLLKSTLANPAGLLYRLQSRASATGSAQEDVFTRTGHLRLSVHAVADDAFVWRIERVAERAASRSAQETQHLPMIMVGRTDAVLYMN